MASNVLAQAPVIAITGADQALEENIRLHLRIGSEACDTPVVRLERLQSQVLGNAQRAANALGYYRATVTPRFSANGECWRLDMEVSPGDQIPVTEVSIHLPEEGEAAELFRDLLAGLPDLRGKPLNHGQYEAIKNTLSAGAVENGYFGAQFLAAEIRVDLAAYQAGIFIDFDPGPRYRFGVIRVLPVEGFSSLFLERLVSLRTGMPYTSAALLEQRNRLDETQYFRQINISPQLTRVDNLSVPVIIELIPRLRHAYSTGLGFTTDTGPRVRASYENRYINSRGHRVEGDIAVSKIRSLVNLGYAIPMRDPLTENLYLRTGYVTEKYDTFESDQMKLETAFNHEWASGWLESTSVDFLRDDYIVDQQADTSILTMLGYSLSKSVSDDFINPIRGWRLFAQVRGASNTILSDTNFIQFYGSAKAVLPIGNARMITRVEAGSTWINNGLELPASVRFFAGGDRSLRGYDYKSLGPENDNGEVVGGKHLLVGSVEFDYLVKSNWRAAVFYDAGNAFSTHEFNWRHSIGVGLRWLSPLGPVRADIAHPLEGGGVRLHITMGPDL